MSNPAAPTESPQHSPPAPRHLPPASQHLPPAPRHLVLIPSYNTGRELLRRTVAGALRHWQPVWVVVDGSTDGSDEGLESLADDLPQAGNASLLQAMQESDSLTDDLPQAGNAAKPTAVGSQTPLHTHSQQTPQTPLHTHPQQAPQVPLHTHSQQHSQANPQTPLRTHPQPPLRVIRLPRNGGKGRAVRAGMRAALAEGFSHALCFDADGQHPADAIPAMMALSAARPLATVMGQPVFGSDAPAERLFGRKIANFFTEWETGHCGLGDTLFGMRVYRIGSSLAAMQATRFARRFDFDPEIAVRLCWQGVQPLPFAVPCRYLSRAEGGVSHFNYLRDNVFQIFLHVRLLPQYLLWRWLAMRAHKRRWHLLPPPPLR